MIAILRETRFNRYTLNTLSAILEASGVAWASAASCDDLAARLSAALRRGRKALALFSFMTPHLQEVRAEVERVRRLAPGALFLAGGPHASADPEGTLALGFHHVFVGEAEQTLPAFAAAGGDAAPILSDSLGGPPDLDGFPPFGHRRWGPVELTRGCRYRCSFCAVRAGSVRHRSRGSVLAAARTLRAMGKQRISFVTPDALSYGSGLADLEELLAELHTVGMQPVLGTFPSEVRPDRVTPDALALLRKYCANRTLVIGAQCGSDEALARLRRGHTVYDVETAALQARRAGFTPHVDLIFGLPEETPAEQAATVNLADRLRRNTSARIHAHYFHPLPGTAYWGREPAPLGEQARAFLRGLRDSGVEDGSWELQEQWAWRIVEWARQGWIKTPASGPDGSYGSAFSSANSASCTSPLVATTSGS